MQGNRRRARGMVVVEGTEAMEGQLPLEVGVPIPTPGVYKVRVDKSDDGDVVVEIARERETS